MPRQSPCLPARGRNQIDVGVSFIKGAESDHASIWREDGVGDGVQAACQTTHILAVQIGYPEIIGVDEGDVLGADRRLTQQSRILEIRLRRLDASRPP